MSDLRALYQQLILDHNRRPRNRRALEGEAARRAVGHNPLCGDRVTVYVRLADGVVEDVSFEGEGCAISTASASMMTEALRGRPVDEVRRIFQRFHAIVTGEARPDPEAMGKLAVFAGVSEYPARVKCATLAWHTLEAALEGADAPVSTE